MIKYGYPIPTKFIWPYLKFHLKPTIFFIFTFLFLLFMKTFETLWAELSEKALMRPEGSGTVDALDAGIHSIGKKILEEAGEVWLAAEHESDDALAEEISQLIYHLQTLMLARGLTPQDVYKFL